MQHLIFEDGSEFLINSTIRIKMRSPLFNEQSSNSYPFTIPYTNELKEKLSYRHEAAITHNKKFKEDVTLRLGNIMLKGVLVVNEIKNNELDCHFSGQNGFIYHSNNTQLSEVFADKTFDVAFSELKNTLVNPDSYDFIFAPMVNADFMSSEFPYTGTINEYDIARSDLVANSTSPKVPFFRLKYLVKGVFDYLGIDLLNNPYDESDHQNKYLVNNYSISEFEFDYELDFELYEIYEVFGTSPVRVTHALCRTAQPHGLSPCILTGTKLYKNGVFVDVLTPNYIPITEIVDEYTFIMRTPGVINDDYPPENPPVVGEAFNDDYVIRGRKTEITPNSQLLSYEYTDDSLILHYDESTPLEYQGEFYVELGTHLSWSGRIVKISVGEFTVSIPRDNPYDMAEGEFHDNPNSSNFWYKHVWLVPTETLAQINVANHLPDMTCTEFIQYIESTLIGKFIPNDTLHTAQFMFLNDIPKYNRGVDISAFSSDDPKVEGNDISEVSFTFKSSPDSLFNDMAIAQSDKLNGIAAIGNQKFDSQTHTYYEYGKVFFNLAWKAIGKILKTYTESTADKLSTYTYSIEMPPVISQSMAISSDEQVQIMKATFSGIGSFKSGDKLAPLYFRYEGMQNTSQTNAYPLVSAFSMRHDGTIDTSKIDLCLEGTRGIIATYAAKFIDWLLNRQKPYSRIIIWPYQLLNNFDYTSKYIIDGVTYVVDDIDFVRQANGTIKFGYTKMYKV